MEHLVTMPLSGMKFNKSKCQILPLGWSNTSHKIKLGEEWLQSSPADRNPGVLVGSRLIKSQLCALVARKANHILGCVQHSITSQAIAAIIMMCSALVQPHLKH